MRETFGHYELLHRFAAGGMAEVFMARRLGVGGFTRDVVIKRMLAHLANDDEYVRMFFDEARLTATLQHPNIAQVLDLGWLSGTWFIAMEFVDGPDLTGLMLQLLRNKRPLPVSLAVWIVARAADGLHFAHEQADPMTGEPLAIVHRDVSLSNILVSRFGDVKVADFGIARAALRDSVNTQVGQVKGKPGYLAPEQIRGEPFGRRVDVFALGVVLWELLVACRLYHGRSDFETLEQTLEMPAVAPSSRRDEVDDALDAIVLAALEREPHRRLATAAELASRLDGWLGGHLDSPGSRAGLARWLKEATPELWLTASTPEVTGTDRPAAGPQASAESEATTRVTAASASRDGLAVAVTPVAKDNLIDNRDRFIGRTLELEHVGRLLAGGSRLLTLHGVAGVGKSRLAEEIGRRQAERFVTGGGLWRCSLEQASSVEGVCSAVAAVLQIPLGGANSADAAIIQVGHALAGRGEMLLLLDDADRIADGLPQLMEAWLATASGLQIVITARTALRFAGAVAIELLPLSLPPESAGREAIVASESVQLLMERAAGESSDALNHEDVNAMALLAQRLDGIPLAIELAAAQMATLSPSALLARLSCRFDVLETGRGRSRRRQTLRGAIDWSWHLLQPWERDALVQTAVFRGGFTMAAAEAVVDLSHLPEAPGVAVAIAGLRERSMLRTEAQAQSNASLRFGLYQSIRAYAGEAAILADANRRRLASAAVQRLRLWALNTGERLRVEAAGRQGEAARAELVAETDNIMSVYDAALAAGDSATALRLTHALYPLFIERGPLGVLARLFDVALQVAERDDGPAVDPALLAETLAERAEVRVRSGEIEQGRQDAEQALLLAIELQDERLQALAHLRIGTCLRRVDGMTDAMRALVEARRLAVAVGDLAIEAEATHQFGCVYYDLGEHEPAQRCFESSYGAARRTGDQHLAARARANIGCIHADRGRLDEAEPAFIGALEDETRLGNRRGQAVLLSYLALVAQERGDTRRAQAQFTRAVAMIAEVGDHFRRVYLEGFLAWNHLEAGELQEAWKLLEPTVAWLLDHGDRRWRTMLLASLGYLVGLRGDPEGAEERLSRAERIAETVDDPVMATVVDLMRAATEAAAAQQQTGRQRSRLRSRAQQRLASARAPQPATASHHKGRPALPDVSSEVRFAIRLVEKQLAMSV